MRKKHPLGERTLQLRRESAFVICHSSLIRHSSFVLCHSVSKSGRISWPLAFILIAIIVATVLAIIFWRIETWPARTAQQSTAELEKLAGTDVDRHSGRRDS